MNKLTALRNGISQKLIPVLLVLCVVTTESCYQYRVINTDDDPGTEYQTKVMYSYAWGIWNKPQNLRVPDCPDNAALNQVEYSKNFGQTFLTVITIGIVSPIKVKWKCHKPCQQVANDDDGL